MFVRIVKMEFREDKVAEFLKHFERVKLDIRNVDGCRFLELYRDRNDTTIFFTYSYWDDDASLENYRNSDLFKGVWAATKPLFAQNAQAWSVDKLVSLG